MVETNREDTPARLDPAAGAEHDLGPAAWQERGRSFLAYAQEQLLATPEALAYLQGPERGLKLETITAAGLGYNPQPWSDAPQRWGLDPKQHRQVWIPRGWVIPYERDGVLWYIKLQQPAEDGQEGAGRYKHITGGRAALYSARHLKPDGRPLVLTEGELDCLLLEQEAGDLVQVAALGSAGRQPSDRWLSLLLVFPAILVAYDAGAADQPGLGAWLETTAKARVARLPSPTANDITAFWREGGDVRAWLTPFTSPSVSLSISLPKAPPRPVRLPTATSTGEFDRAFAEWAHKSEGWYAAGLLETMREQWPDLAAESDVLQNQLEKLWGRDLHAFKKALDKWERIFLRATSRLADKAA